MTKKSSHATPETNVPLSDALFEISEKGSLALLNNVLSQLPDAPPCMSLVLESYHEQTSGLWMAMGQSALASTAVVGNTCPVVIFLVPLEAVANFHAKLIETKSPIVTVFDRVPEAQANPNTLLVLTVANGGVYPRLMEVGRVAPPDAAAITAADPVAESVTT